jgi:ANTAR domain
MLDRAEGVLVALRRCTIDAAFDEIVGASQRHNVPALQVAQALVELAQGKEPGDGEAADVARMEWSGLLAEVTRS